MLFEFYNSVKELVLLREQNKVRESYEKRIVGGRRKLTNFLEE